MFAVDVNWLLNRVGLIGSEDIGMEVLCWIFVELVWLVLNNTISEVYDELLKRFEEMSMDSDILLVQAGVSNWE